MSATCDLLQTWLKLGIDVSYLINLYISYVDSMESILLVFLPG